MMMEIDLHGLELWEALEEIVYKLEESLTSSLLSKSSINLIAFITSLFFC